jgi:hypothetical protein
MLDDVQIGQLVDGHYWVAGGGGGMCAVGGTPGVGGKGNDGVHARQGAAVSTATTPVKYTTIPGGGGAVGTAASGINSSTFTAGAQGGHGAIILRTLESEPDATITNGTKMVVNGYRYYIFRHTGTHYVAYTNGSIRWA